MTDHNIDNLPARLVPPGPGARGRTHWRVTPLGLALVEELAGRGCHLTTIARVLGMHVATLPRTESATRRLTRPTSAGSPGSMTPSWAGSGRRQMKATSSRRSTCSRANTPSMTSRRPTARPTCSVNVDNSGVLVVPEQDDHGGVA